MHLNNNMFEIMPLKFNFYSKQLCIRFAFNTKKGTQ